MDTISISHATKLIQKRVVLDDVSVELDRGGIYSFSGINGSGKSMLFKAIAGLVHLTSGSISVFGRTVGVDCSFPPDMGIVMSAALWDEYTAVENLELIASIRGVISRKGTERALRRVGLDPNDRRIYKQFSLGMKQRLRRLWRGPPSCFWTSQATPLTPMASSCSVASSVRSTRGEPQYCLRHTTPPSSQS